MPPERPRPQEPISPAAAVTIPHSHVHVLESESVGRTLQVWVAEPVAGFQPLPPGPRQVLVVLDADLFFGTAVETARLASQLYGELPPLVVVGVAYGEEPGVQGQLRTRDFTPSDDPGYDRMAAAVPGFEPLLPEGERMAGADRFLRCLRDEVWPLLDAHYEVDPTGSAVFGSSLGGLFAAYTLLTAPETFSRYLITSPALWWNEGEVLKLADGSISQERTDPAIRVYLAAGSREEDPAIPMLAPYRLVSNTRELGRRLEANDLDVTLDVLAGETHTSAVPVSLARGLRALFGRARQERPR